MFKRLFFRLIICDILLNIYFASWSAFFSSQLAIFANLILPFISFLKLKQKLPKFVIAKKPSFFIQNDDNYTIEKGLKANLKVLKYAGIFFNLYKFCAYFIFIVLILTSFKHNLFNVFAFFSASVVVIINLLLIRVKYG